MLDTGSEEHVCNPGFLPRGNVLSQSRGVMRGTSWYENTGHETWWPKQFSKLSCCTASWNSRKIFRSVGKMIDSGSCRVELYSGNCGGSYRFTKLLKAESD